MECLFNPCIRKSYAKDLCQSHYKMNLRGEDLRILKPREGARLKTCTFDGCHKPHKGNNLCSGHNYQLKKFGILSPIKYTAPGEWGEWKVNVAGYVKRHRVVGTKRESQLQHRYIMEEYLGRELLKYENIHHKNGNRSDNRLENLEVWSSYQPAGQRIEDKVKWAKEILDLYGEEYS